MFKIFPLLAVPRVEVGAVPYQGLDEDAIVDTRGLHERWATFPSWDSLVEKTSKKNSNLFLERILAAYPNKKQ